MVDPDLRKASNEVFKYLWRQVQAGKAPEYSDYQALLYRLLPGDREEKRRLRRAVSNRVDAAVRRLGPLLESTEDATQYILDSTICNCEPGEHHCRDICLVDAIVLDDDGNLYIDPERCIDCGQCHRACASGAISHSSQLLELAHLLRDRNDQAVYAILAPSFAGQFEGLGYQDLKSYLLALGFDDVWEVALAADVLTVQEAEEFVEYWRSGRKFMITSCCCPAFIKLVERHQPDVSHLVSHSVSPMIAMGRILKAQDPHCKVVFIGPCLAKRAEIRRPELEGDVDLVLTFKEFKEVVLAVHPDLAPVQDRNLELREASHDGRSYAFSGGVTDAILAAIEQRLPGRDISTVRGNGLKECLALLKEVSAGDLDANFMEGMGCPGGCVGGPGTIIPVSDGEEWVKHHASVASIEHAYDNKVADSFWESFSDRVSLWSRKSGEEETSSERRGRQPGHPRAPDSRRPGYLRLDSQIPGDQRPDESRAKLP